MSSASRRFRGKPAWPAASGEFVVEPPEGRRESNCDLEPPNSLEGNEYEAIYLESRRTQSAAWPFRVTASLSFAVFARKPRRSRRSIRSGGGIPHSVPFANSESVVKSPRCKSFLAHEVNITDAPTETDFDAI